MSDRDYILTIDELALQIHRILKDLYPLLIISGDDIRKFIKEKNSDFLFFAQEFAVEFKLDSDRLTEKIYLELMVEYEKNWHDRVFFKILRDNENIFFNMVKQDKE